VWSLRTTGLPHRAIGLPLVSAFKLAQLDVVFLAYLVPALRATRLRPAAALKAE